MAPVSGKTAHSLDTVDRRILHSVQADSRQPIAHIAERAGLSTSACHRRLRQLEDDGVITGYTASLDRAALGYTILFFVEVSLASQSEGALEQFEREAMAVPEILECHLMSGQADYLLRIAARDAADYERIHRYAIARLPGVARIQSSLALRTVKPWTGYPIQLQNMT